MSGKRIPELDGLRGIAILLVLVYHFIGGYFADRTGALSPMVALTLKQGWIGVDLFFVLSGFLIGGILMDSRTSPRFFKTFYVRRFYRIMPLYWVLLALSLVVLSGLLPFAAVDHSDVPWWAFLTFTQNFWTAHGRLVMVPFMGVTWSLAVEEQFYLTVPVLVRFVRDKFLPAALMVIVVVAPLVRLVLYHYLTGDMRRSAPYELTICRADALGMGVLAAVMLRKRGVWTALAKNGRTLYLMLGAFALGMPYFVSATIYNVSLLRTTFMYSWIAMFFLCLLLIAVTQKNTIGWLLRARALTWMGGLAYCLYLFHSVFGAFAHGLLASRVPKTIPGESLIILISLVLTFTFAKLSWRFFEKPLIDRAHVYRY